MSQRMASLMDMTPEELNALAANHKKVYTMIDIGEATPMKERGRHIRTIMRLILFAVCFNAAVQHLNVVAHAIAYLLGVAAPILLGLFAAFILTIPINALEKHLIRPHGGRALKLQKKLQCPRSIALSIILIVAAIAFVSVAVIPNLVSSLHSMIVELPALLEQFKEASMSFNMQAPGSVEKIQK
ncbi:MAG: hypothetical protein Q4G06_11420 [Clostridia bacterium]|nr:hypothetical protein [Clostridia bacterium]